MDTRSTISPPANRWTKKIWARQASKEILLCSTRKSAIILGVANEATHISIRERFASRKHIGVWRQESGVTVRMMRKFPSSIARQSSENMRNKKGWSSWELESPSNTNSVIWEWFVSFIDFGKDFSLVTWMWEKQISISELSMGLISQFCLIP